MKKRILIILTLVFGQLHLLQAQHEKFGKIDKSAFEKTAYDRDSAASAVVLYKDRNTHYEYNKLKGWEVMTTVYERIQFFSKKDIHYATKKVPLYDGFEDQYFTIKAFTYNLENGKIAKTKLNRKEIYEEQVSEKWKTMNFTMPNVKEGSIIEWQYTVVSPYTLNIQDVICQYDIPIAALRCEIEIPEYFVFNAFPSRYYPLNMKTGRIQKSYAYTQISGENTIFESNTSYDYKDISIWENTYHIKKDHVPALISEPYVNNIDNYRAKVQFEISAFDPPNGNEKLYNTSWSNVTRTIYDNPRFGRELKKSDHFVGDLQQTIAGSKSSIETSYAIFDMVKNKMKWNGENNMFTKKEGIEEAYRNGVGNAAEINLTLVAMLRSAGINANPVLVSTRSHGIPLFPTTYGFNYVIAGIEMNNQVTLMDATEKYSLPDVLPLRDLNWEGRLIRKDGSSSFVNLFPKVYSAKEVKINAKIDPEGGIHGTMITTLSGLNAVEQRKKFQDQDQDHMIVMVEDENQGIEIENFRVNNLENPIKPLTHMVKFHKDQSIDVIGGKMYLSPLLFLTVAENPFKLSERSYPIDYGSPWKNETKISLEIPAGYSIESKPQDISLALPDQMGTYILKTELKENKIVVSSQTKFNTPVISQNHYDTVKELYKRAIENQLEKIILVERG